MIAAIERAIAARIRAAALGYAFGVVSSYDEAATQMADETLPLPAVIVSYDGEDPPERLGDRRYRRTLQFTVRVAAQQWVNVAFERRKAETGLPGAYQIIEDLWFLLADHDLGLDIGQLTPGGIRPDAPEEGYTICALDLTCDVTVEAPEVGGDIGEYLRHHIDWDIPPHGNVEPPLPTAVADARDDIVIRTE